MKRRVLLLGGSGMIGSQIIRKLRSKYFLLAPSHSILDVNNFKQLKEFIYNNSPEGILYLIGVTNPDSAELERKKAFRLNFEIPQQITFQFPSIPFYYFSTDSVFSGDTMTPYKEDDPPNPINYYGYTKMLGEKSVLQNKINTVIRTISVYSEMHSKKTDFVRKTIDSLMMSKKCIGIIDQIANPTYGGVIPELINKIIETNSTGIIHIGAFDYMSNFKFIKILVERLGFSSYDINPITMEQFFQGKKAKRGKFTVLSVDRILQIAGREQVKSIEESINLYYGNYLRSK